MPITTNCPVCRKALPFERGSKHYGVIQHHLWGGHKLTVQRSHEIARKIDDETITQEELDECKQIPLPL